MYKVLTIAGSDCSGGAGIQADIKTMTAHRMYAMSAITALTAQNTLGVSDILGVTPAFLKNQLDCIFTDIYPDAVKIGMVADSALIEAIAERLRFYHAKNIVADPVMAATSGARLLAPGAQEALIKTLLPLATVITPNIPEAEMLWGCPVRNEADMVQAGFAISEQTGTSVLVKGGHNVADASDVLIEDGKAQWFHAERIANPNTHGTGCTLSSAIACNLAAGFPLAQSVSRAKDYLTGALAQMLDLGQGAGPLDHMWRLAIKG
ncbi:MAG: bifunctional hydroxymethylpyrimidine kinase/phosphomethylpyrimidine kinase [Fusobacteriaceae bacterium]|jgi:hydroxymethylpyrimidine/phosphomethylpyrimidine kinase|nr:bifunctional hydroxymethylpyrimidine kinase/phosphomethylpyrimidine kinase [Fusobacteriaceae bacterium]